MNRQPRKIGTRMVLRRVPKCQRQGCGKPLKSKEEEHWLWIKREAASAPVQCVFCVDCSNLVDEIDHHWRKLRFALIDGGLKGKVSEYAADLANYMMKADECHGAIECEDCKGRGTELADPRDSELGRVPCSGCNGLGVKPRNEARGGQ